MVVARSKHIALSFSLAGLRRPAAASRAAVPCPAPPPASPASGGRSPSEPFPRKMTRSSPCRRLPFSRASLCLLAQLHPRAPHLARGDSFDRQAAVPAEARSVWKQKNFHFALVYGFGVGIKTAINAKDPGGPWARKAVRGRHGKAWRWDTGGDWQHPRTNKLSLHLQVRSVSEP